MSFLLAGHRESRRESVCRHDPKNVKSTKDLANNTKNRHSDSKWRILVDS